MSRAVVVGGSLGGLTAALVLRDQGWDVDVLERSAVPLQGRGAGIVAHPTTVRYLVERVGKAIGDIGVPASRLRYLGDDGSVAHEQPCAHRLASYFELYRGLLDAFGTEHYHLSTQLAHLDNRDDEVALSLTDGQTLTADLVVCADGIRSTGRSILVPDAQPRYAGYVAWRGTIERDQLSGRTASVLQDAITYRILPNGHLLTYPIPGTDGVRAVQLALVPERRSGRPPHRPADRPKWFQGRADRATRIGPDQASRSTAFRGGHRAPLADRGACPTKRGTVRPGDRRPRGAANGLRDEAV